MKNLSVRSKFDLDRLIRPAIKKLKPYSSARDEFKTPGGEMIFLDANENPYGSEINRYPDPYQQELKEVLAKIRGVDPEGILVGNGSDEVLDLLFRAFCEPGVSNIITLSPTYGMYQVLADINDTEVREIPLDQNWQPEPESILAGADENTRMVFFCSPNNPTGNLMNPVKIQKVLNEFNGLVVIDEAYIDFADTSSWSAFLEKYPNLVIVQTLSKAYGLAGARVGYVIASKDIVGLLNGIKPPYNVNLLSQVKALETLKNPLAAGKYLKIIETERTYLTRELNSLSFVSRVYPSDANFILFRVDDAGKRYSELLEQGIVVRNRSSLYGCENTLRVTIGTPEENLKLINALKQLN